MVSKTTSILTSVFIIAATSSHSAAQCSQLTLELLASDGVAQDYLGSSVALNGGVLIAGAYGDDEFGVDIGSAYVFDPITGAENVKLVRGDTGDFNYFGWDVDLDGTLAVVGALGDDDLENFAGAVYVFDTTTGNQTMKLHASDGEFGDRFGYSVAVDGGMILVGAAYDNTVHGDVGSAYLFDAATGTQLMHLNPSDKNSYERFGSAVALHNGLAVIGAPGDNANGYNAGAVYVYDVSTGAQLFKLIASDGETKAGFGDSVDIEGNTIVVGASGFVGIYQGVGTAYTFDAVSGAEIAIMQPEDGALYDSFGSSVGVSGDTVIVGAIYDDDNGGSSGSAYLFDAASGTQLRKLVPSNGTSSAYFGYVAIEGDIATVGANGAATLAHQAGSVYVYDLSTQGSNYCQSNANSTGLPALLTACGSTSLSNNDLTLSAYPVPNQFGLFFYGFAQTQSPFGNGFLCATGSITRLNPPAQASGNLTSRTLNMPLDGLTIASTYNFQCWYRDPAAGGSGFNLSNGLSLTMVP